MGQAGQADVGQEQHRKVGEKEKQRKQRISPIRLSIETNKKDDGGRETEDHIDQRQEDGLHG